MPTRSNVILAASLPFAAIVILTILVPFITSIYLSITDLGLGALGADSPTVGLANYAKALADPTIRYSVTLSTVYAGTAVPVSMLIGGGVAFAAHRARLPNASLPLFLVPAMLPTVAVGLLWRQLLSQDAGAANYLLERILGLDALPILTVPWRAILALAVIDSWQWAPAIALVLLAAVRQVPRSVFDAARIDAIPTLVFLRTVLGPMVLPAILTLTFLRAIQSLWLYDLAAVMTGGGPGRSTEFFSLRLWRISFQYWNVSYGAALSVAAYLATLMLLMFAFPGIRKLLRWR